MLIRCIAVDDEPLALEIIREYASRFPALQLVQTFDDAISAAEFMRSTHIDLVFLDINMPDINGIELARSLSSKPIIIFTTAHKKFAFEGFELEALDYLLKPVNFDRFSRTIKKALEYYRYKHSRKEESDSLFVYSEYRLLKIELKDVEYIESLNDYIRIHFANAKPILSLMPLKKVLEKLPADKFKRIHRSYIVSVDKVTAIANRKVQLSSQVELPISESYASFIDEWKKN